MRTKELFKIGLFLILPSISIAQNWLLTGNPAVATNFLGTTNNIQLKFRTTNTQRMIINANNNLILGAGNNTGYIGIGLANNTPSFHVSVITPSITGGEVIIRPLT